METILYSGLTAGLISIVFSLSIEKLGGRIGGLIAALPSTIVPGAIGLSMSLSEAEFRNTIYQVPLGIVCNILFLYFWKVVPPKIPTTWSLSTLLTLMSIGSLSFWGLCVYFSILIKAYFPFDHFYLAVIFTVIHILVGIAVTYHPFASPKSSLRISKRVLALRGVFAFLIIGFAIYLSKNGSQSIAGFASVFPVIFFTTMFSLWLAQGGAVPSGAVGPMMLGSASASLYAVCIPEFFAVFGYWLGTLINWIGCVMLISVPSYFWLNSRKI
jgi:hypothetical protein